MAIPTTKDEFKEYCLRRLGKPVIQINVDDEQVDDRIDEALYFYRDQHADATIKNYLKHQITQTDVENQYIPIPEDMIGVIGVIPIGRGNQTNNLFNLRYQIHLNDLFNITSTELTSYWLARRHIELIEEIFVGNHEIIFNRHQDRLHIPGLDWNYDVQVGHYIIIEGYQAINTDDLWSDRWLQNYATALIKRQFGENLKKFSGVSLPGGIQLDGQTIWQEANEEIKEMEDKITTDYGPIVMDMMN